MSGLGLGFKPTETGVSVVIVRADRSRVGYIDYTHEEAAKVASYLLDAMAGKKPGAGG